MIMGKNENVTLLLNSFIIMNKRMEICEQIRVRFAATERKPRWRTICFSPDYCPLSPLSAASILN